MFSAAALLCAGILDLAPVLAHAEEVDDYIRASQIGTHESSTEKINEMVNEALEKFEKAYNGSENSRSLGCDKKQMDTSALEYFNSNMSMTGNRLRELSGKDGWFRGERDDEPKKTAGNAIKFYGPATRQGSIYEDMPIACCVRSLKLADTLVGLDKVDHFFGNGGLLYERRLVGNSDEAILEMNVNQEQGSWGLAANVKSYGDLSANWAGFKWYGELFGTPTPYFKCEKGKIKKVQNFNIAKYVDDSWAESINCSAFPSREIAGQFAANLKKADLNCPNDAAKCKAITEKYKGEPKVLYAIISPTCRLGLSIEDAVEAPGDSNWTEVRDIFKGARLKDFADPDNYRRGWVMLLNKVKGFGQVLKPTDEKETRK